MSGIEMCNVSGSYLSVFYGLHTQRLMYVDVVFQIKSFKTASIEQSVENNKLAS